MSYQANQALFTLSIEDKIHEVAQFRVINLGISQEYSGRLELILEPSSIAKQWQYLPFHLSYAEYVLSGYIHKYHCEIIGHKSKLTIEFVSPLSHFLSAPNNKTYEQNSGKALLQCLFAESKLCDYELNFEDFKIDWQNQHNESPLQLFMRIIATNGLLYYYQQTSQGAKLVVSDSLPQLPLKQINYLNSAGMKQDVMHAKLRHVQRTLAATVSAHDYCNKTAQVNHTKMRVNETTNYGDMKFQQKTSQQLEHVTKAIAKQQQLLTLLSDNVDFIPGQSIQISQENREWAVMQLESIELHGYRKQKTGSNAQASDDFAKNTLQVKLYIRPELAGKLNPQQFTPEPASFNTALVAHSQGPQPDIDAQAKSRLHMKHVLHEDIPSPAVHTKQFYTGAHYGMHHPLHDKTEVLTTYLHGSSNTPLIHGALSNGEGQSPVVDTNKQQARLSSYAGSELLFDDTKDKPLISLHTPDKQNFVELSAEDNPHHIKFVSNKGCANFNSNQAMTFASEAAYKITSANDLLVKAKNNIELDTKSEDILINTKSSQTLRIKKALLMDAKTLAQNAKQGLRIQAEGLIEAIAEKSAQLHAKNNQQLKSKRILIKARKTTRFKTKASSCTLSDEKLQLVSHKVTLNSVAIVNEGQGAKIKE